MGWKVILLFIVCLHSLVAHSQLVTANEGDAEVVITYDYSKVTSRTPKSIQWDELDENRVTINPGIVNHNKMKNGRFRLHTAPGEASLVILHPLRNDSHRIFRCQIQTTDGSHFLSNVSILTVYFLDQPLLHASASTIYEGETVTFTCSNHGGDPTPYNYITWYKDGKKIINDNNSTYVLEIVEATADDSGRYTCKAESDQFEGDDGKTSAENQLNIYYIIVTFKHEDGFATCTAEGHPKPSSVLILKDGEMVKKGECTATVGTNETICQSNITCYAGNGKLNDTTTLKNCKPKALPTDTPTGNLKDGLFPIDSSTVLTVAIIIALILGSVPAWLTSRYIYQRRLREIRSNCQNLQYQAVEFPSHSGVSNELNTLGHMVDPKSRQNTYRPIPMEREEIEIQCQHAEVLYEEPHVVTSTLNKGKVTEAHYCGQFYD